MARWLMALSLLLVACPGGGTDDDDAVDDDDTVLDDDDVGPDDDDTGPDDDDTGPDDDDAVDDDDSAPPDFEVIDPWIEPSVHVDPPDAQPGDTITLTYTGELDGADTVVAHYGYNGWNLDADGFESEADGNDTAWFADLELTRQGDAFVGTIEVPADARAIHVAFNDPDADEWDNNDGLDYFWAFGDTYTGPWLTWNDEATAAEGVVVNWESSVPCLGIVEYGPSDALGQWAVGDVLGTVHHVPITGLAPDSVVYYRVRESSGVLSPVYDFRTAAGTPEAYRFVAMADMQDDGENQRWTEVAAAVLAEQGDAAFLVVPGDMPANDKVGHWWWFFDVGRELLAGRVIMPAVGNHDTPTNSSNEDTSHFRRYFELPGELDYYAFDYGDSRFLALTSEGTSFAAGGAQYAFVQDQLADAPGPAFAYWHKPPYNAGIRHGAEQDTREITQLFDGAIDWVFGGHEHLYQRMVPIRHEAEVASSGQYGRGTEDGVGYVVLPPSGNGPSDDLFDVGSIYGDARELLAYPVVGPEDDVEAPTELGYVVVDVSAAGIGLEAYAMGSLDAPEAPRLIDEVVPAR